MAKRKNVEYALIVATSCATVSAAVTACNFVSTDGLTASAGASDSGPTTIIIIESPDATTTAAMDAGDRTSVDATKPDAGEELDAAPPSDGAITDAGVADAAKDAGPFCATPAAHTLCFDFEEGNLLFATSSSGSAAYLSKDLYGVGMMGLTTMGPQPFPSPTTAFLSTVTETDAAANVQSGAAIQYNAPSPYVSRFELSADMYLSQNSALQYGASAILSFAQISSKGVYSFTNVDWSTMGLQIANVILEHDADTSQTQTVRAALPFSSTWQHVHMVVTRTAPMGHLLFTVDDATIVDADMPTLSADTQQVTMDLGLNPISSTPAIGVLFDNVAVDVAF